MIDTEGIGHRIQRLRKEKGLTQEQVAESLDMSVNYLSNTGRFWKCQYQTHNLTNFIFYGKIEPYTITPDFLAMVYWKRMEVGNSEHI